MLGHLTNTKIFALSVYGTAFLLSVFHIWSPITISSPNRGGRTGFLVVISLCIWFAVSGYRNMRIALGILFAFLAAVDCLLLISYFSSGNWLQLVGLTAILASLGYVLLARKEMQVFEENHEVRFSNNL